MKLFFADNFPLPVLGLMASPHNSISQTYLALMHYLFCLEVLFSFFYIHWPITVLYIQLYSL